MKNGNGKCPEIVGDSQHGQNSCAGTIHIDYAYRLYIGLPATELKNLKPFKNMCAKNHASKKYISSTAALKALH